MGVSLDFNIELVPTSPTYKQTNGNRSYATYKHHYMYIV